MGDESKTPFKLRFYSFLLHCLARALIATCRTRIVAGEKRLDRIAENPVIFAAWHNRIFYFSVFAPKYLISRGIKLAMMSSLSKDGAIGASLGQRSGLRVVRGSAHRGGTEGFRRFYRVMKKESCSTILLPDGSRGPIYKAKMGVAMLAKLTGAPVVPISYQAERCWRVRSWDRLIIPKPFSRIAVVVGDDLAIERDADDEALERGRARIESALNEAGARAAEAIKGKN